jgi:hypothetical protein
MKFRRKRDRGEEIVLSRGVSVTRAAGSNDWYVNHSRRTGMWTWTPQQRLEGPFRNKQDALLVAKDINRNAPVPWGEPGYKYIRGDGPHGDPQYAYPGDDVPLAMSRENPTFLGLSGTDILLGLGGLAAVGIVSYLVYKQQQTAQTQTNATSSADSDLDQLGTNIGQALSPTISYAATDINPPPPAIPVPPPPGGWQGTSPLPVAPT